MLLRSDIDGSLGRALVTIQGDRCEMQFSFTQDHLCTVKSHALREMTLLHRTQRI